MSKSFGETIGLNQVDKLESIFKDRRKKLLCVNDDVDFKEENIIRFKEILNEYYPEKSAFEKLEIRDEILFKRRIFTR